MEYESYDLEAGYAKCIKFIPPPLLPSPPRSLVLPPPPPPPPPTTLFADEGARTTVPVPTPAPDRLRRNRKGADRDIEDDKDKKDPEDDDDGNCCAGDGFVMVPFSPDDDENDENSLVFAFLPCPVH